MPTKIENDEPTIETLQGLGYSVMVETGTILKVIEDTQNKRKDVARMYRQLLCGANFREHDWPKINRAIIKRWSMSGLLYIKRQAWNGQNKSTGQRIE